MALKGIETYRLGAPSGLRTEVEAGIDFRAREQLAAGRIELHDVSAKLREIRSILAPLNERMDSSFPLSPAEEARQQELTAQFGECQREQARLLERIESLQNCGYEGGIGQVNVKNLLREGVVIAIGKAREEIKNELSGPLSIIESARGECLRYLPMTPLGKPPRLEDQESEE